MSMRRFAGPAIGLCLTLSMTAALGGCAAVGVQGYEGAKQTVQDLRPTNLKTHSVAAIKTVQVDRIAVMPLAENPPQGGEPLAEGASEAVTAELYSQVSLAGGWDIIPQDDVMQAMQKLPPTTAANLDENALKLGKDVSADAVLYGTVERYKERVGLDYAAASPASVTFDLRFADMKTQQVIWTAKFAKSQKALSQNVLDLANFVQNTGRWVRAHEIALEGVKEAVSNLHDNLNLEANIQRFETGTYGQLKSGRQRYSSGPGGIQ